MIYDVLFNILWIIVGYLIGSINFSIILTKNNPNKKNIKEVGSGNAGATNAARVYGLKFGILIFFLDASKSYWFAFTLGLLQNKTQAFSAIIPQLCTLGVIVGHIFPVYFNFKGGKGAATLLGMIASISLIIAAIGTVLFLITIYVTKYISVGSIVVPYIVASFAFLCQFWKYADSVIMYEPFWVSPVCLFVGSIIVSLSHWPNIIKLINRNESKISFDKFKRIKNKKNKNDLEENIVYKNTSKKESIIDRAISNDPFDL